LKEARRVAAPSTKKTEQLIVRVSLETYSAMQLAQPFVQRRSMQDFLTSIIDDFLQNLRTTNAGFEKALVGLRESEARRDGVLTRRAASRRGQTG
jgi:hypothetical protein